MLTWKCRWFSCHRGWQSSYFPVQQKPAVQLLLTRHLKSRDSGLLGSDGVRRRASDRSSEPGFPDTELSMTQNGRKRKCIKISIKNTLSFQSYLLIVINCDWLSKTWNLEQKGKQVARLKSWPQRCGVLETSGIVPGVDSQSEKWWLASLPSLYLDHKPFS